MATNADQFAKELKADVEEIEDKFVAFRADIVADMLMVAAVRTPTKSKKTVRAWGASAADLSHNGVWRANGPGHVRRFLRTLKPRDRVYAGNSWFVSGFLEKGTGPRTKDVKSTGPRKYRQRRVRGGAFTGQVRARRMLQIGIEAVKDRKA